MVDIQLRTHVMGELSFRELSFEEVLTANALTVVDDIESLSPFFFAEPLDYQSYLLHETA